MDAMEQDFDDISPALGPGSTVYQLYQPPDPAENARLAEQGRDPERAVRVLSDPETGAAVVFSDRRMAEALQRLYGGDIRSLPLQTALARGYQSGRGLLVRTPAGDWLAQLDPAAGSVH